MDSIGIRHRLRKVAVGLLVSSLAPMGAASAVTPIPPISAFADFGPNDGPAFEFSSLVEGADGDFYGVGAYGGSGGYGYAYKVSHTNGQIIHLHDFQYADGATPRGTLALGPDGALYGVTEAGGANRSDYCLAFQIYQRGGCGVAFKVTSDGQFTKLHDFYSSDDGYQMGVGDGLVYAADGNFYGNSSSFLTGKPTVFRMTNSGQVSTFYAFTGSGLSTSKANLLQGSDGNLYGTMVGGGRYGYGFVFQLSLSGSLKILHSFQSAPANGIGDGALPWGTLVEARAGTFYGTTNGGGSTQGPCLYGGCGTIFKITSAGRYSVVYRFTASAVDGMKPENAGLARAPDGNLYGVTQGNPQLLPGLPYCTGNDSTSGCGTLFRIDSKGHFSLVYNLGAGAGQYGYWPDTSMLAASDGNLYGITESAGLLGEGVVYRLLLNAPVTSGDELKPFQRPKRTRFPQ